MAREALRFSRNRLQADLSLHLSTIHNERVPFHHRKLNTLPAMAIQSRCAVLPSLPLERTIP
jgi:hypothetical protein